jgi:Tfp pilus assembly protein PilX
MSIITRQKLHKAYIRQDGMVSIMVVLILMMVISLMVLGFAQIARRNQRQTLDRQLSTQAFYAAETGINDAASLLKGSTAAVPPKTSCADNGGGYYSTLPSSVIDATSRVAYTCLMVNPTPSSLIYSNVGTDSIIAPLSSASGASISRIKLSWQTKLGTTTPMTGCPASTVNAFKATTAWTCGYGVLRYDLVPYSGTVTAAGLQTQTMTSFLVPVTTGGAANLAYSTTGAGDLTGAVCTNTECSINITGLSGNSYYMRVRSLYQDISLQITGTDSVGNAINFQKAQALVDSTGKAQDVLRRIQVRVPLNGSSHNLLSDNALTSTDPVCKRFVVMDGSGGAPGYFKSFAGITGSTNPLCL